MRCIDNGDTIYCFKRQICNMSNIETKQSGVLLFEFASICDLIMKYAIGEDVDMDNVEKRIDDLIMKAE